MILQKLNKQHPLSYLSVTSDGCIKKTGNVILMGSCHTEHGPLQGVLLKPAF